jgi:lysophospholipase L1-like esterase
MAKPKGRLTICALGDSLTAGHISGTGRLEYFPYTEVLRESLQRVPENDTQRLRNGDESVQGSEIEVKNFGLDGDLTEGMIRRLERQVLPANPDIVLICGGANDLGWGLGVQRPLQNITQIVESCRRAGALVIVGSVPPIEHIFGHGDRAPIRLRKELNERLEELADRPGVYFVDLFNPLACEDGTLRPELSSDGLHLNREGYETMGNLFLPALREAIRKGA